MTLRTIILAAGQGKRMFSDTPKVLHPLAGQPLLAHVIDTAKQLNPESIFVIHGHQGEQVRQAFQANDLQWIEQREQLGTGHAVSQVLPELSDEDNALILFGDVPLISKDTLSALIKAKQPDTVAMVVAHFDNPTGLGRIIRDDKGHITRIVEQRDANPQECAIKEINAGIFLVDAKSLKKWLPQLNNDNAQKEYYLPGIIPLALKDNQRIVSVAVDNPLEVRGVNSRLELIELERAYQQRYAEKLLLTGVTVRDPKTFYLRGQLTVGQETIIDANVVFEGKVTLGRNCFIEPHCILRNVTLGDNVHVKANSLLEDSTAGNNCIIGPYARLRPETTLADNVKVGNFVEIKKSQIDAHSKIPHLSYIGDTTMGKHVNVGAGTITCNYDGAQKHQTVIENNVFIGSDTQLIAPIKIAENTTIGAGSTLTKNTEKNTLTLTRAPQTTRKDWKRPKK